MLCCCILVRLNNMQHKSPWNVALLVLFTLVAVYTRLL